MKNFLKNNLTYILFVVIIINIAVLLIMSFGPKDTVAKINGEKITKDELYQAMVKNYGAETLDSMISERIVEMEATKQKITITDQEIQEELNPLIESTGGQEAFEQQLALSGVSLDDLKKDIASYLKTVKLLEPQVKITDEEISAYFEKNKDSLAQEEQVEASHILVADEATAKDVKQQLDNGGDFAELAAKYSTDKQNNQKGGELGSFARGEMVEAFDAAVFSMEVGQISEPIKTEFGYHIVKVTDKQEAKEANLEDSKAEIEDAIKNGKINEVYTTWLTEKKAEYSITNNLVKK